MVKDNNRGWHIFLATVITIGLGFMGWISLTVESTHSTQGKVISQMEDMKVSLANVAKQQQTIANNTATLKAQQDEITFILTRLADLERAKAHSGEDDGR